MRSSIIALLAIFCSLALVPGASRAAGMSQATEKGSFVVDLPLKASELKNGPNLFDFTLRDREGRGVTGAEIAITPWMPTMGHGVWEKPVVTERGGGTYHVENVVIIMGGRWDLKFEISTAASRDVALFSFDVPEKKETVRKKEQDQPTEGFKRTVASYNVPNVTLLNQDGKKVNLRSLVESGKPVIVNFIFTTCTTICPVMSASFSNLRTELGARAERVQLISISIDPENDRPERLKQYASRFNWGPGWELLTGSRDEVGRVLKAFDAFIVDKMSHEPLYLIHAPNTEEWIRIKGLVKKKDLMKELRDLEAR